MLTSYFLAHTKETAMNEVFLKGSASCFQNLYIICVIKKCNQSKLNEKNSSSSNLENRAEKASHGFSVI